MYWGVVAADQWEANKGDEIGNIFHPVWHSADGIFVQTGRVDDGVGVAGIFDVAIDPVTHIYRGFRTLAFSGVIRDYDYDSSTGDFAITYSNTPDDIQTVWARAVGDSLVVGDTILDASWFPLSARFVSPGGGLVVYAHHPSTSVNGFYYVSKSAPSSDSLLYAIELSVPDARGFDIAGGTMCFGQTGLPGAAASTISVIDLAGNKTPRTVAVLEGAFVSAGVHATGACAVVSVDDFTRPGSVVWLLDLTSGSFTELNVRTRPCGFVTADFTSWNPAGDAFAFSGSGFDGEGGQYPRQLWVKRLAACQ
ncbi:MAG TPA: hypothetical protein VFX92_00090 [Candidatus Krumholzibacteria bacterium]|nr:hypothetical protein [Candidatus Krumholzibacteria bacterium]